MRRPDLEVADIFRARGHEYRRRHRGHISLGQLKAMSAIERCRTAELGGHQLHCETCNTDTLAYNSCRNRHCPKCQASAAERWLQVQSAHILPVPYFHVVFTLPEALRGIACQNKASCLRSAVQNGRKNPAQDRGRQKAPRGRGRTHRRAAHLGIKPHPSSPPALYRHRRGFERRWRTLDPIEAELPGSRPGARPTVPALLPRGRVIRAHEQGTLNFFGDLDKLNDSDNFAGLPRSASGRSTGSSMPSGPSQVLRPYSPTSPAIPTASPSPTAGY